jgi:hypothetical protein
MRQFEVIALSIMGKGSRIYNSGANVSENHLLVGQADELVRKGFIREKKGVNQSTYTAPNRFKIAIITAMWKRPEIFKVFGQLTNDLIKSVPECDFQVFCVGSEGKESRQLAESFGFTYIEHPNDYLGQKWNAVTLAAKSFNPDYCLMMGSDDVMDATLFRRYLPYMQNGIDYIGVLDWYFYDTRTKEAIYWAGYRKAFNRGVTCGAGRFLSAAILESLNWQPWEHDRLHNLLDTSMENRLKTIPHSRAAFIIKDGGGIGLDIKSSTNMTPFAEWDNSWKLPSFHVLGIFTKKQKALICAAL